MRDRDKYRDRLRSSEWNVEPIDFSTCKGIVGEHHYARGGSNTATFCHGLIPSAGGDCHGIAWWLPPTRTAAKATYPIPDAVLSLSRLVIIPGTPKNAATFLVSRSVKLIRDFRRWRCLVTYADEFAGHTGEIYHVLGWEYLGVTKPNPVWVDDTGRIVSRKRGPITLTYQQMNDSGYRMAGLFAKHKFRYIMPP